MDKFVILKPLPGNAAAIGNLLDRRYKEQLFAILNDDDSILMIAKTEAGAQELAATFQPYQAF